MRRKVPKRDPISANARETAAKRRVGGTGACVCGESRPQALMTGSKPITCFECDRKNRDRNICDKHHPAGQANSPITIPTPVNDHRAVLSEAQYDWPTPTLQNPNGSPILAAAACIRGFCDTILYLAERLLLWIVEMLELLDAFLSTKLREKWWVNTEIENFKPKH
jgi:hypothetical protein